MDDDFNTPKALAVLFDLIKKMNPQIDKLNKKETENILDLINGWNKILGILPEKLETRKTKIPSGVRKLITEREKYRQEKNWQKADEIREKIKKNGYVIKDTKEGPKVKPVN